MVGSRTEQKVEKHSELSTSKAASAK